MPPAVLGPIIGGVLGLTGMVASNDSQKSAIKNNENQQAAAEALATQAQQSDTAFANKLSGAPVSTTVGSAPTITGKAPTMAGAPSQTNLASMLTPQQLAQIQALSNPNQNGAA